MQILRLNDQVHQLDLLKLLRNSTTSTIPTLPKAMVSYSYVRYIQYSWSCTQNLVRMARHIMMATTARGSMTMRST